MNILVTGSCGFIGFHVAQALLKRGDRVIGLDNISPYYDPSLKEARVKMLLNHPNFIFVRADILDRAAVRSAMRGIDRVCHLAALAGVRYSSEHPQDYVDANLRGFFHVLDEARLQKAGGFIYASSSSIYGGNETFPSTEAERTDDPVSFYGMTKKDNELMAGTYHRLYGLPVTGLRFFTVYGPWGRPDMALFLFTDAILRGQPIKLFGHGKMRRDFTYIDDIVSGVLAAIDRDHPCDVFNLGSGRVEELMDFVSVIETAAGRRAKKELLPMPLGEPHTTSADIAKARRMLAYEPKTMIGEGVPKFVEWFRGYYKI